MNRILTIFLGLMVGVSIYAQERSFATKDYVDGEVRKTRDLTPPTALSAVTNTTGDTITITMSEAIYDTTILKSSILIASGVIYATIDTILVDGSEIHVVVNDVFSQGNSIYLTYNESTDRYISDIAGNAAADFFLFVTNRIITEIGDLTQIATYDYENSVINEFNSGTYDGTASTNFGYATFGKHGAYSGNFDGQSKYVDVDEIGNAFTTSLSFDVCVRLWGYEHTNRTIWAMDGVGCYLDAENGKVVIWTTDGADTATAETGIDNHITTLWYHIAGSINKTTGKAYIFINGVDQTSDSTVHDDFSFGDLRLGLDKVEENQFYGYMDYTNFYTGIITESDAANLFFRLFTEVPELDTIKPTFDTAYTLGNSVYINASEAINPLSLDTANFNLKEDGTNIGITSAITRDQQLLLTVDSVHHGRVYTFNYDKAGASWGYITDAYANLADTFTIAITNNTKASPLAVVGHYEFENNFTNSAGDASTGVLTTSITPYYSSTVKKHGSYGFHADKVGTKGYVPALTIGDQATISTWIRTWGTSGTDQIIAQSTNWTLRWDVANEHPIFKSGSEFATSSDGSTITATTDWIHVVAIADFANDTGAFYVNNVYKGQFDIANAINNDGNLWLMSDASGTAGTLMWGYMDELHIYDGLISSGQVNSLYTSPNTVLSTTTPDDDPDPDPEEITISSTYWDVLIKQTFGDNTLGWYNRTDWLADWNVGTNYIRNNYRNSDAQLPTDETLLTIVEDNSNQVLRFYSKDGCVGTARGYYPTVGTYCNTTPQTAKPACGDEWYVLFDDYNGGKYDEAWMSYEINFASNFNPVEGGKIPFLEGGEWAVGADGRTAYNASCLLMFQPASKYIPGSTETTIIFYYYHAGIDFGTYASTAHWKIDDAPMSTMFTFDPATEGDFHITLRMVMNTFTGTTSNADGFVEAYVDGVLVGRKSGIRWMPSGSNSYGQPYSTFRMNRICMTHFFGGNTECQASVVNTYVEVDNVVVFVDPSHSTYPAKGVKAATGTELYIPWMKGYGEPVVYNGATQINSLIGKGIDVRNVVDDGDGYWNMNATYKDSAYFHKIAQKGFESVRLVIKSGETNRLVPTAALDNVCEIIDSCVSNGLFAIFDYHISPRWWGATEGGVEYDAPTAAEWDSLAAHWGQFSQYFKDKYPNTELAFELANEPRDEGAAYWADNIQRIVDSIRVYDANRLICIPTIDWGQISGLRSFAAPVDTMWALTLHYYSPEWVTVQNTDAFGHESDAFTGAIWPKIPQVYRIFEEDWAQVFTFQAANDNVPINVTEWGTFIYVDSANRVDYAAMLTAWYADKGITWTVWDHMTDFGVYKNPTWGEEAAYGWYEPLTTWLLDDNYPTPAEQDSTVIIDVTTWAEVGSWTSYTAGTGAVSLSVVGGKLRANVTNADGIMLNVRLKSPSFELNQNDVYKLTYTIRTGGGVRASIAHKYEGFHPWRYTYNLGTNAVTVVETYIMPRVSQSSAEVEILLGAVTGDVYLENFKLQRFEIVV